VPEATEKITVNLSVVDVGRIDILVEQGFYANRTDFVKSAVRASLEGHETTLKRTLDRLALDAGSGKRETRLATNICVGTQTLTRADLEEWKQAGERVRIICVGALFCQADIPASLVEETVEWVRIYGILKASPEVKKALSRKAK